MATTRKHHLQYQHGPACQRGRAGGLLQGREHSTVSFNEFRVLEEQQQCSRCRNSHPFIRLMQQGQWEPEAADAWKDRDDALAHQRRAG